MLLEFSIENFRCYKEKTTFDFKKITAIFGNNASGKTNMLNALSYTLKTIKEFSKIDDYPPLYKPNDKTKPVTISLKFSDKEKNEFLYELSVKEKLVLREKYEVLKFKDLENHIIFTRDNQNIKFKKLFKHNEEKDIKNIINILMLPNNTFASFIFSTKIGLYETLAPFYELTRKIFISIVHDMSDFKENDLLEHIKENNGNKREILELAKLADSTITDITISEGNKIICHHGNEKRNFFKESSGTRKTIYMTPMLIHAKKESSIFLIDEIDTHFHPLILSLWLEKLSEVSEQVIFVGHNPLVIDFLMSWKVFNSLENIIYLYRNEENIIKNMSGKEFYTEDEDINLRFSELIYHNWNNYYKNKLDYI